MYFCLKITLHLIIIVYSNYNHDMIFHTSPPPTATPRPLQADGGWHTTAPPGTPHTLSRAPSCTAGHLHPPGDASEYTYKFRLTLTTPSGIRAAVALSWSRFVQNINSL